jgi:hypothetical protein
MRLFGIVAVAVLLTFAGPVRACGDMAVTLTLVSQWPEARGPMVAEIRAARLGLFADTWQPRAGADPIMQRQERAGKVLRRLQAKLETATADAPASFTILFLEDHIWSRFAVRDDRVRLELRGLRPVVPAPGETRVHVSLRMLDLLLAGGMTVDDAVAEGLVAFAGAPDLAARTRATLAAALTPEVPS